MRQACPTKLLNECHCQVGSVAGGVVKMQEFPSPDTAVRASPCVGSIKTPQNSSKCLLVHSLWLLDEFVVDHAPAVEESQDHHLGSCNGASRRLRTGLTRA